MMLLLPVESNAAGKVKLSSTKKTVMVGKTVTIRLKNNKKKVKWSVSNKKIKIVKKTKQYAKVKALKKGKCVLKAKVGKKTYKCQITVKETKEDVSKYTGYFTDAWDADYLIITHDGKNYGAEWFVWRRTCFGYPNKMKGVKNGDVIRFTDVDGYIVIDVEFKNRSEVVVTVVDMNNSIYDITVGKQYFYKRGVLNE